MKKHIFSNPIKEALYTQGKRWTVGYIVAVVALAIMAVLAWSVKMPICGSVAAFAVMLSSGFFICFFGIETVKTEEE